MKLFKILWLLLLVSLYRCGETRDKKQEVSQEMPNQYITVLGIAQDAGYPQIDCEKACCRLVTKGLESRKMVTCLGLIDKVVQKKWLFEATPDMGMQLEILKQDHLKNSNIIDGVFLTHAHMGHYTGLMYFGREAMGAKRIPVYVMPRMKRFLETNGPWRQLVALENIQLREMAPNSVETLNTNLKVTPINVPHRDEFSETVGYKIEGPQKSALFIPDIDKWELWENEIISEVRKVEYAFLDATFFKDGEIDRPMTEVPHPFVEETVRLFENESKHTKSKIYFIHFNHSNPAILQSHSLKDSIQTLGFNFAKEGDVFAL